MRRTRYSSEIYYWFTEGFDTRDLIEAKAVLDELGPLSFRVLGGSHRYGLGRREWRDERKES